MADEDQGRNDALEDFDSKWGAVDLHLTPFLKGLDDSRDEQGLRGLREVIDCFV